MGRRDNGWSEHGGYMAAKVRKLNNQFMDNCNQKISNIFSEICIFINGFTEPSDDVLKKYMEDHGGRFCHYYKKDVVTHIIATNLPQSKINKLRNEKVVTAKWIVDSVEAGQLLDWSNYELYADRHKSNQNMMKTYVKVTEDQGKSIDTGALSLSEFYAKSRLHHLSSWANDLNNYLHTLKSENPNGKFPARSEFLAKHKDCSTSFVASEPLLMHVDMDCFFVSVGLLDYPDLIGRPVVVTHSTTTESSSGPSCSTPGAGSMSEIASCSYEARARGLSNGMHLGKARKLCPDLVTIPYSFSAYLSVAKTLYRIAAEFTHEVSVGSCDELYLGVSGILSVGPDEDRMVDPQLFAEHLRTRIHAETGCVASCGIGANLLLCKLATKRAKPNGCYWLRTKDAANAIRTMAVRDLPGIGRVLERRLLKMGIDECSQLQDRSLEVLKREFGSKFGQKLFDMCRGNDNRPLQTDRIRKSISAEINYGIRLDTMEECSNLLRKLSQELSERLQGAGRKGRQLVLKLMVRQANASVESVKYLGHGICDNFSKSTRLSKPVSDADSIVTHAIELFLASNKPVKDLRGVGLAMQKLDSSSTQSAAAAGATNNILNYFTPKSIATSSKCDSNNNLAGSVTSDCCYGDNDSGADDDDDDADCTIVEDPGVIDCLDGDVVRNNMKIRQPASDIAGPGQNQSKFDLMSGTRHSKPGSIMPVMPQYESTDQDTIDGLAILGHSDTDKLYLGIMRWVDEEPIPDIEDCALIRRQLMGMVLDNITLVHEILVQLRTNIDDKHRDTDNWDAWNCCYNDILSSVQAFCFQQFGAYLEFE